jgi:hypothetical protein
MISTVSKWLNQASTWALSPNSTTSASKMIYEPVVRLAQTVHLSCTDTNTVSKWIKTRFHMTHVTGEFHHVHLKWFLSLWYVLRKPSTYLSSTLTLSPTRSKGDSTWPTSPRSSISCIHNDFCACGTFGANCAPIYISISTISKLTKTRFHMTHSPRSSIRCIQNDFRAYGSFGANHAPILHQD